MIDTKVNLNIVIEDEIRRLANAKAALLGVGLPEYISQLIIDDTKKQKLEVIK